MVQLILIRPGSTDYDHQGRIQGNLDIPLSDAGRQEVAQTAGKLQPYLPKALYCSPNRSAEETAEVVGGKLGLKPKSIERLQNVNLGLWQGLLIEEVRHKQPKVYKQWQEHPETIEPPDGEMLSAALERASEALEKLAKKHRSGTIAVVVPEPLASMIQHRFQGTQWSDLWRAAKDCQRIEVMYLGKDAAKPDSTKPAVTSNSNGAAAPPAGIDVPVSIENRQNGGVAKPKGPHQITYRGVTVNLPLRP